MGHSSSDPVRSSNPPDLVLPAFACARFDDGRQRSAFRFSEVQAEQFQGTVARSTSATVPPERFHVLPPHTCWKMSREVVSRIDSGAPSPRRGRDQDARGRLNAGSAQMCGGGVVPAAGTQGTRKCFGYGRGGGGCPTTPNGQRFVASQTLT